METNTTAFGGVAARYLAAVRAAGRLKPVTLKNYEAEIGLLRRHWTGLADLPVDQIRPAQCRQWLAARRRIVSPQQANHELVFLKRVLELARREGLLSANPAAAIRRARVPGRMPFIPTWPHVLHMIYLLRNLRGFKTMELVELLAFSGMTPHEARFLTWADVDFKGKKFTVTGGPHGTRDRRPRTVPLFPPLHRFLLRVRERRGRVRPAGRVLRIADCHRSIRTMRRILGVPGFDHQCLRYFFIVNAMKKGVPAGTVAQWIGQKNRNHRLEQLYRDHARRRPASPPSHQLYSTKARLKNDCGAREATNPHE